MFDPKYPASCPSCQASTEDRAHFWRCPAPSRMEWRKNFLTTLRKQLIELKTAPPLQSLLLGTLRAVLDGRDPNTIPVIESLQDLATSQASIGWNNLLKGRLSKEWAVAQQAHLGTRVAKTSPPGPLQSSTTSSNSGGSSGNPGMATDMAATRPLNYRQLHDRHTEN